MEELYIMIILLNSQQNKEIEERVNQIKEIQVQKAMAMSSKIKSHAHQNVIRTGIQNRKSNGNV